MNKVFAWAHNVQMVLLSTQAAWAWWMSCTFVSLPQIQLGLCCFSTQLKQIQGNSPSYEQPVFVSPQAGDKGMRLYEKNTAALPWKRLPVTLYSLSARHNEIVRFPPSLPWVSGSSEHIRFFLSMHFHPSLMQALLWKSSHPRAVIMSMQVPFPPVRECRSGCIKEVIIEAYIHALVHACDRALQEQPACIQPITRNHSPAPLSMKGRFQGALLTRPIQSNPWHKQIRTFTNAHFVICLFSPPSLSLSFSLLSLVEWVDAWVMCYVWFSVTNWREKGWEGGSGNGFIKPYKRRNQIRRHQAFIIIFEVSTFKYISASQQ